MARPLFFLGSLCVLFSAILAAAEDPDSGVLQKDSECVSGEGEACTFVALQRYATKKGTAADSEPRSDRPTATVTSSYKRPRNLADAKPEKFVVNQDCPKPPCSGQVHIQLGGPGEMVVVFASQPESLAKPLVSFGKKGEALSSTAEGATQSYSQLMFWSAQLFNPVITGGHELSTEQAAKDMSTDTWAYDYRTGWKYPSWRAIGPQQVEGEKMGWYKNPTERYDSPAIHTVVLSGLEPGVEYAYQVDNDARTFNFKMPQEGTKYPYTVGITADIGQTPVSNSSFHLLRELDPEVVLLAGDLSYADGYFPRWDSFGIMAEPLNARVPVMSCPGNHEYGTAEAFKSYNARYPMPFAASGSFDPNYWSRDIGPMHVVALNSYASSAPGSFQYQWLKNDLNKAFSREKTPWLVVMMHAPFYNSNLGHLGEAKVMQSHLEDLFYDFGVNIVLAGHVHSYERSWPVYQNVTTTCAPVYLNIGDGGNREGPYHHWLAGRDGTAAPEWSAFRQGAFGIAELVISNATHAKMTWKRNACFDNGEADFHPENCSSTGDNSKNALSHDDSSWIVRSTETCPNMA